MELPPHGKCAHYVCAQRRIETIRSRIYTYILLRLPASIKGDMDNCSRPSAGATDLEDLICCILVIIYLLNICIPKSHHILGFLTMITIIMNVLHYETGKCFAKDKIRHCSLSGTSSCLWLTARVPLMLVFCSAPWWTSLLASYALCLAGSFLMYSSKECSESEFLMWRVIQSFALDYQTLNFYPVCGKTS
jgi:hypothetical protein